MDTVTSNHTLELAPDLERWIPLPDPADEPLDGWLPGFVEDAVTALQLPPDSPTAPDAARYLEAVLTLAVRQPRGGGQFRFLLLPDLAGSFLVLDVAVFEAFQADRDGDVEAQFVRQCTEVVAESTPQASPPQVFTDDMDGRPVTRCVGYYCRPVAGEQAESVVAVSHHVLRAQLPAGPVEVVGRVITDQITLLAAATGEINRLLASLHHAEDRPV